jgi:hypothetical protein
MYTCEKTKVVSENDTPTNNPQAIIAVNLDRKQSVDIRETCSHFTIAFSPYYFAPACRSLAFQTVRHR